MAFKHLSEVAGRIARLATKNGAAQKMGIFA
jgi:hypothetical protein